MTLTNVGTTAIYYSWQQGPPLRPEAPSAEGSQGTAASSSSSGSSSSSFYQHDMKGALLPGQAKEFR
jgi:hypothetical protein